MTPEVLPVGVRIHHAHLLVGIRSQQRTVVARDATRRHERLQPLQFHPRQRLVVSLQKVVQPVVRHQRPLKCRNRLRNVLIGQRGFLARERRSKSFRVFRHRRQLLHHLRLAGHRHFDRIQNRPLGLGHQIRRTAIPELGQMKPGVQNGRRIPAPAFSKGPWRGGLVVHAAHVPVHRMAGIAGLAVVC